MTLSVTIHNGNLIGDKLVVFRINLAMEAVRHKVVGLVRYKANVVLVDAMMKKETQRARKFVGPRISPNNFNLFSSF